MSSDITTGTTGFAGYEPLEKVLREALEQAAAGKGKERHASDGRAFTDQPIMTIARDVGIGFLTGQAIKKAIESRGLYTSRGRSAARNELLGAIVYLAAAVIRLDELAREK